MVGLFEVLEKSFLNFYLEKERLPVVPQRQYPPTRQRGVTTQSTAMGILSAVQLSELD